MNVVEIDKAKMYRARQNDLILRGKNCIVYNYWGDLVRLNDCEIWYNNKWQYVKPKHYIKKNKKKRSGFFSFLRFN